MGSQLDVKELEYVSALHQTNTPSLRRDGSIQGEDIKAYLQSRFGIDVTVETVRSIIMQGLGGSDDVNEVIDLMELKAIILIPLLLKARAALKHVPENLPSKILFPPRQMLETASLIILRDVFGDEEFNQQVLNADFIKQMLTRYGETRMAEDGDLINEMIQQARANGEEDGNPLFFNVGTFAEALTKDVTLYNINNEANASTLTQDIFQEDINNGYHNELTHVRTAPEIDIQAGTYRSKGAL